MGSDRVLICGLSARAAAASAARAGFAVTALDAFGDLDRHERVRAVALPHTAGRSFVAAAARAARDLPCDAVAYLSPFENHPDAVETLARGRTLWGNPPDVLARIRNPALLARALRSRGLPALRVLTQPPRLNDPNGPNDQNDPNDSNDPNDPNDPNDWLLKPIRSGGGHGIRPWQQRERLPRGTYLQQRAEGVAGSLIFLAAGGRAEPIGLSRQLIGDPAFGAGGYRYCGNLVGTGDLLGFDDHAALLERLGLIAAAVTEEFGLTGINGIDFVARAGVPFTLEVNPRWSGAAEVVERWSGVPLFAAHAAACTAGVLPREARMRPEGSAQVSGKAILFARTAVVAGDTRRWLADDAIGDVPQPQERIAAGRPVCTIFAAGRDADACRAALVRRAGAVYEELEKRRMSS